MNPFRIRLTSSTALALTLFFTAHAQTAKEIVAKHIEALGGKAKLQSINSVFIEGIATMSNGAAMDTKLWKVYDRLYRQEISSGSASTITIVTPNRGWISEAQGGGFKSLPSDQLRALQPEIDPAGPLADYDAKGCKVDLDGKDTINGAPCYRIKLSCPMGQSVVYSIDIKTYYILRESRKGGSISVDFSDYKTTPEGYVFPFTILTGGAGEKINVEKIEVNHNVDLDTLGKPRKAA
ncbi:hypothetical protein ACQ86N_39325 [Puia sp. P3]|uniref:hypothetical protein n=1 Tax=Puia sp. P3 TaxID=3423952 RepID=UPI003D6794C9